MNYDKYMKIIDLHTHSDKSDGTLSPAELVACAAEAGLSAVALTDHDTVAGVSRAMDAGLEHGVEVIPGVEIDAEYMGDEIHVLGYFIDYKGEYFSRRVNVLWEKRMQRNEKLLKRLASLNMPITEAELSVETGGKSVTRLHFAKAMVKKGYVSTVQQAFERFLDTDRPAFVPRFALGYKECIEMIHEAGGIASLAHPYLYKQEGGEVIKLVERLREAGLDAVEAIYPTHDARQTSALIKTADRLGMKISGGSDFHGDNKPHIKIGAGMDNIQVGYEILDRLRDRS